MNVTDLFPYVVPNDYFRLPGGEKQPSRAKWGVVEQIGPDLHRMLVKASGGMVRNVHEDDLHAIGLSVEEANAKAIQNLRAIVEGGEDIQRQASLYEDGVGQIVWMGNWLTASCIVLPELHSWASRQLNTEEMLVSVPQQDFMFLFSVGDADFRNHMKACIKNIVEGMEKRITFDLFLLSERGLAPYTEGPA